MTLRQLYNSARIALEGGNIEAADEEALIIIELLCNATRSDLIINGDRECSPEQAVELERICRERIKRYPLQYILKEQYFFGEKFSVGEGVLIPRDDTEVVLRECIKFLEAAISVKPDNELRVIDLCSGSGIIAVILKKQFPHISVTAVEKSPAACEYLRANAAALNADITIIEGDIFEIAEEISDNEFDLIVSNPPYIKTDELAGLQTEVKFEPSLALDGGSDGLDFYRRIVKDWAAKLKNGGALAFELGEGQADDVADMMRQSSVSDIRTALDLGGEQRAIIGTMQR